MKLDELGLRLSIVKVEACNFQDVVAQLSPSLSFRKDRLPQRPGHIAALFCLAHLEDQFHAKITTEKLQPQTHHRSHS